jgi:hypothetical protein
VPEHVALEGVSRAPQRTVHNEATLEKERGSILLAYEGKGDENGRPLITLNGASQLRGVIVFYPEQNDPKHIVPFPWTVHGAGDNCTITDVLLVNPYQAVDFGTEPAGRHYINGLYAQPLKTGLFIDKCFDVGRVENIHFWPFWTEAAMPWTRQHGTAFLIARTDWEYMTNCFCISYATGYHFIASKDGPGNAVLTQCGSDIGPLAVKIDALQSHAGVSFVNGQFMAGVEIAPTNTGPVKFTACGFWGISGETDNHIRSAGRGHVTLTACHFSSWGQKQRSAPCILAQGGSITVNGCDFLDAEADKTHIELQPAVRSAAIFGNHFRARPKITNHATKADVQIGLNVSEVGE